MSKILIGAAITSAAVFAAPASAAIVSSIGNGQTFCESLNVSAFSASDCDLGGNADLSNSLSSTDALTFLGTGTLAGFVADDSGVDNGRYPDYATITLNQDSLITMMLVEPDALFDAAFSFGSIASATLDSTNSTLTFLASAGSYFFGIDATNPTDSATRLVSSYRLDVAAVPVPAGGLLMLTALGGLTAARRKRKS